MGATTNNAVSAVYTATTAGRGSVRNPLGQHVRSHVLVDPDVGPDLGRQHAARNLRHAGGAGTQACTCLLYTSPSPRD